LPTGIQNITASYTGDSKFLRTISQPLTQTVVQTKTTIAISSSAQRLVSGQPITLTAVVSQTGPRTEWNLSSVAVAFLDGEHPLAGNIVFTVAKGTLIATMLVTGLSPGSHKITASYSGGLNSVSRRSDPIQLTVFHAATTCVLSIAEAAVRSGQVVTLTAKVSSVGTSKRFLATLQEPETVRFFDGAERIVGTVVYHVIGGNLIATLTTSQLAPGLHKFKAVYLGDADFLASKSSVANLTIKQTTAALAAP
jgi:hypothetical protein